MAIGLANMLALLEALNIGYNGTLRAAGVCGRFGRMAKTREIKCPTCKKTGDWFATPFGPFCSKRCRLVDLGKWLGEEKKISEPLRPDHFKDFENLNEEDMDKPK